MKNYMEIIGVFIGILANIFCFTKLVNSFNPLIISMVGIFVSIFSIVKSNKKRLGLIGILLNTIPIIYFFILILAIG